MKTLSFWFDPISPYAYLAFEQLPQALEGCSYAVEYRPVLFAGLLGHWGQKGPAEIEPKRAWTFRQVAWAAHRLGVPLDTPAQHPFNPLALLRLALASAPAGGLPNRRVVELVMRHVWHGGAEANDAMRLQALGDAAGLDGLDAVNGRPAVAGALGSVAPVSITGSTGTFHISFVICSIGPITSGRSGDGSLGVASAIGVTSI